MKPLEITRLFCISGKSTWYGLQYVSCAERIIALTDNE